MGAARGVVVVGVMVGVGSGCGLINHVAGSCS